MGSYRHRRRFDKQFKVDAVELTLKGNTSIKKVADDLGIDSHMLARWRRDYLAGKEEAFPGSGNAKDSEAEKIRQLERELKAVTEEREILKKALAVFSR